MNGWIDGKRTRKGMRYYVFTYEGRDPATRKRVGVRSEGGHKSEREAKRALRGLLAAADNGGYVEPSKLTVGAFLRDQWLPAVEATVKSTTFRSYEMHVRCHIAPPHSREPGALRGIGSVLLQKLDGAAINKLYAELRASGLAPASVRRVHAVLHRALKDAVRWKRLIANPVGQADPPKLKGSVRKMATWSGDELRAFLTHVREDRLLALWHLLASTGMRRGEALGLRWEDVGLETGTVAVRRALVTVGYQLTISTPKNGKGRSIDIDEQTVAVLRAHKARQAQDRLAIGPAYDDQGFVFAREDGAPVHPDRASKMFDALVASSGCKRIRLHDLRHTHASLLLEAGEHPKVVQERLGHSSIQITLDTYSHVNPSMGKAAARRFGDILTAKASEGSQNGG